MYKVVINRADWQKIKEEHVEIKFRSKAQARAFVRGYAEAVRNIRKTLRDINIYTIPPKCTR